MIKWCIHGFKGTLRVVGQWANNTAVEADRNKKLICENFVPFVCIAQMKQLIHK